MGVFEDAVRREDVKALTIAARGRDKAPYPTQQRIIRDIAFQKHNRILVLAYTRYGKTFSIGVGVALRFLLDPNPLRVIALAPSESQAKEIRNEFQKTVVFCEPLAEMLDVRRTQSPENLMREMSTNRMTFEDGSKVFETKSASATAGGGSGLGGAGGMGSGLMSKGADLVLLDESCQIKEEVWQGYVVRMLENENAALVEASNPWHKNNHFYRHYNSPRYRVYQVGMEQGIAEGRHSRSWFEEKRQEVLTDYFWKVLYLSEFPDELSERGLFKSSWLEKARSRSPFEFDDDAKVCGLDVAEFGSDRTVLTVSFQQDGFVNVVDILEWGDMETMDTVERVDDLLGGYEYLNVDAIGIGSGVASALKKKGYGVYSVKVSQSADTKKFRNVKALYYWRLRDLFEQGRISLPDEKDRNVRRLCNELLQIQYETGAAGVKILDPDKSPDFADSLMLCCCRKHAVSTETAAMSII